jgi:hypothetical protein
MIGIANADQSENKVVGLLATLSKSDAANEISFV